MTPAASLLVTMFLLAPWPTKAHDDLAGAPTPPPSSTPTQATAAGTADSDAQSDLSASGAWRVVPPEPEPKTGIHSPKTPPSVTITWPALDPGAIEAAHQNATSRAEVTGVHREIPPGFQGDLLEALNWSTIGQRRHGIIELSADGAESIRVQFRASLPRDSSLTFYGTRSGQSGSPPPVWTQSVLASRQADSTAIWSPSGQEGVLHLLVDMPATASLTGHFLTFEKISHRWSSASSISPETRLAPKDGGSLDCPLHYSQAVCHTSRYPSTERDGDLRGMVVHIHYESGIYSYVCSGTMISQKGISGAQLRDLLLTAHHCINTRAEADSIESAHYLAAATCGGSSLDSRSFYTYGGANYLAGLHSADQTLVELRGPFPSSYWLTGWDAGRDAPFDNTKVYGLHHPSGHPMAYSEGVPHERIDISVNDYGRVLDAIPVSYYIGTTEGGSSGSGLFYDQAKGYLVGVLSAGRECDDPSFYGSFRDFFPVIRQHVDPGGVDNPVKLVGRIPYFPRDRLVSQQGFVTLINSSDREATVIVQASRETSSSFVAVCRFLIPQRATRAINSRDLETGNAAKGCTGSGHGFGDWTLEFHSDVPSLDLYVYARALDGSGFLNSLAGTAKEIEAENGYWYILPIVNPASNLSSRSTVRITNLGPRAASNVRFIGYDGNGTEYPRSGTTYLARALAPNQTLSFTSQDLEYGNSTKLRGSRFGDGSGKWVLWVFSPDAPLEVTGLMTSRGLTSNLSR